MNSGRILAVLASVVLISGCAAPTRSTPATHALRGPPDIIVSLSPGSGSIPGMAWILVVMTDGAIRESGFVLSDDALASSIRTMHGRMAVIVRVEQPGLTPFKAVQSALNRLSALLEQHTPEDARVGVYLELNGPWEHE